jgi:hypothetical protein
MSTSVVVQSRSEERAVIRQGEGRGFAIARVIVGVLLLATAGLKLFDPSPDTLSGLEMLSSPRWRMAAIEAEALLGIWLLAGTFSRLLWLAALVGCSILASMSLYLGLEGQSSCGCFGAKVKVSPGYALALDLAVVTSLVWWRPFRKQGADAPPPAILRRVFAVVAGAAVLLAIGFVGLAWLFGSPSETILHLRGESITVEPSVVQVGEGVAGEQRTLTIQLSNHGNRPVTILGGTTNCSCITTSDLPIIVPPKKFRSITIQIIFRGDRGRFQHSFVLYTNDERQSTITVGFVGRVVESS